MSGKERGLKVIAAIILMSAMRVRAEIHRADFGKMPDGAPVSLYTLTNQNRLQVSIQTYGGIITSVKTPDRHGAMDDIVLGFDSHAGYVENPSPFFGAIIGRYANRIAQAHFTLDGVEYKLEKNDGENTLHSGTHGFDKKNWTARELGDGGLELTYISKDGESGFPGTLTTTVTYHLTDANELRLDYQATTDKDTVLNLTNHSYFNLRGNGDILGHIVTIHADHFTPVDSALIPTGDLRAVAGTPFDFRKPVAIGARIEANDEQLKLGHGYDHNWVVNGKGLRLAVRVEDPATGRILEVQTTQPGVQFYTGNFLDGTIHGKGGKVYARRSGFSFETQHFPDSPNQPKFPTTMLHPGEQFKSTTIFKFSSK